MTKLTKKYQILVKLFPYLTKKRQKLILASADNEFINLVSECCFNYLRLLNKKKSNKNRKYIKTINYLKDHSNSYTSKKKVLKQKGGSLLPFLFRAVAPIIANLFTLLIIINNG